LSPRDDAIAPHEFWFGEDQARYVVAVREGAALLASARAAGVPATKLGRTQGGAGAKHLTLPGGATISLSALRSEHERFLPAWMDAAG